MYTTTTLEHSSYASNRILDGKNITLNLKWMRKMQLDSQPNLFLKESQNDYLK